MKKVMFYIAALFVALIVSPIVKGQSREPIVIFAGNQLYVSCAVKNYRVNIETDLGIEVRDGRYSKLDSTLRMKKISKFDFHKINLTSLFKDRTKCKISIDYSDDYLNRDTVIELKKIVYLKNDDFDSLAQLVYSQAHPRLYEKDSAMYISSDVPMTVYFRFHNSKHPSVTLSKPIQLAKPVESLKKEKYIYSIDFGKMNQSIKDVEFSFEYTDVFGRVQYECGCHCDKLIL